MWMLRNTFLKQPLFKVLTIRQEISKSPYKVLKRSDIISDIDWLYWNLNMAAIPIWLTVKQFCFNQKIEKKHGDVHVQSAFFPVTMAGRRWWGSSVTLCATIIISTCSSLWLVHFFYFLDSYICVDICNITIWTNGDPHGQNTHIMVRKIYLKKTFTFVWLYLCHKSKNLS